MYMSQPINSRPRLRQKPDGLIHIQGQLLPTLFRIHLGRNPIYFGRMHPHQQYVANDTSPCPDIPL